MKAGVQNALELYCVHRSVISECGEKRKLGHSLYLQHKIIRLIYPQGGLHSTKCQR